MEILSAPQDSAANAAAAVGDSWQRVGIGASVVRETPRLAQDPEAHAAFPGFHINTQPKDLPGLVRLHSSRARLPENSFQVGGGPNISRYMNAELDGLIDAYFRTIPVPERISMLGRIIRHVAEQLPVMGVYYGEGQMPSPTVSSTSAPGGRWAARTRPGTPTRHQVLSAEC